jgi:hypothetical protein
MIYFAVGGEVSCEILEVGDIVQRKASLTAWSYEPTHPRLSYCTLLL